MTEGISIILKYFQNLTVQQQQQFEKLLPLYQDWNEKVNVISRKDIDQLYQHHVLHSLGIAKIIQFKPGTKVMDIGTGGGFPGIPLAIMFPECDFYLVDSIGKKINVVNSVAEAIGLTNVIAEHKRCEEVTQKFDFIVSRAVTELSAIHNWLKGKIAVNSKNSLSNGLLCLKGGDLEAELEAFPRSLVYDLKDYFEEEFFETKKVVHLSMQ